MSFYACDNKSPIQQPIPYKDNLVLADTLAIGAMKMEVLLRRSNFRDYYDIYSLLKHGEDIASMMRLALDYSNHRLKSKNLLAMLTNGERFHKDASFELMQPIYDVTPDRIEEYIKQHI